MSTNKLSHLKEGDKIYLEVTKADCEQDIHPYYKFNDGYGDKMLNVNTYNSVSYTLEDLKQLANDGMPKHGEMIEARYKTWVEGKYIKGKFICMYGGFVLVDDNDLDAPDIYCYDEWRFPQLKKTELTLAEVEEKLGLEKDSLIIK